MGSSPAERRDLYFEWTTDDSILEHAYRLRYHCYALEQSDFRYADHDKKIFRDSLDGEMSLNCVAVLNHTVIGTNRLVLRKNSSFAESDEVYQLPVLASLLDEPLSRLIEVVGCSERTAIHPEYRGTGLFAKLQQHVFQKAQSLGCHYLVAIVKSENSRSLAAVKKLGWTPYGSQTSVGRYAFEHFVLDLNKDLEI